MNSKDYSKHISLKLCCAINYLRQLTKIPVDEDYFSDLLIQKRIKPLLHIKVETHVKAYIDGRDEQKEELVLQGLYELSEDYVIHIKNSESYLYEVHRNGSHPTEIIKGSFYNSKERKQIHGCFRLADESRSIIHHQLGYSEANKLLQAHALATNITFIPIAPPDTDINLTPIIKYKRTDLEALAITLNPTSEKSLNHQQLPITRKALITQNEKRWPTIENDLNQASQNNLSAHAKAGSRKWNKVKALEWARSNGKLLEIKNKNQAEWPDTLK